MLPNGLTNFRLLFHPQIRFSSVMYSTQELELFPDRTVTQLLFKYVRNAAEFRKNVMEGKINGALINPSMHEETRSLYSQIIYNLSPTNNSSEAFKRFGISDSDSALLIVLVHPKEETQHMSDIIAKVDGQHIPVEDVSMLTDPAKIKKVGLVFPLSVTHSNIIFTVCQMAPK
uniref:EKC/KEOPS complex subunit CGI121 n=1 Tax=Oncorhynchus tshawytscha TaxID=74940 RepID=A0A8C8DDQ3_ONCTS